MAAQRGNEMSQQVMSRADYLTLMEPILRKAYQNEYDMGGSQYDKYWDIQSSSKRKETIAMTEIPNDIPVVNEGGMYSRDELKMGREQEFLHVTYKREIVITEELSEDNLYGSALSASKGLGDAMKRTVEKTAAKKFSEGLTSTVVPSGKTVFATDHPVLHPAAGNPTEWGNLLTGVTFGSAMFKNMKTNVRQQRSETGESTFYELDQFLVPPALYEDAVEMYYSKMKYDSTNHADNTAIKGVKPPVLVTHFQDADHDWADTAVFGRDSRRAMNIFMWRIRPVFKTIYEEATGNIILRVRCRFSLEFVKPHGLVAARPGA